MTETTALLRALHYDLTAICTLLAALYNKSGGTINLTTGGLKKSLIKARKYRRLADELDGKESDRKEPKC